MAEFHHRWPDNVDEDGIVEGRPVRFFVDTECISCTVCSELAPAHFRLADTEDHDVCFRQPADVEQLAACRDALEACPVEAIGERYSAGSG